MQLSLPGAEPAVESTEAAAGETESSEARGAADAGEQSDEDELEAAQSDEPRPQGLVARPAGDDAD